MENNMPEHGSGLDMYLGKITSDVVKAAIDKVSDRVEIEDVESFLEPLNDESFKDSLVETCILHSTELPEIKTEEISNAYVLERCSKLIEDTFTNVYDELQRIFYSDSQEMSNDIESSKKKLQLLECIKDSDQLQTYFQDLSMDIIQNSLNKIVKKSKHMEPYLGADMESDITMSVNTEQGSESNIQQNFSNSIDKYDTDHNYEVNLEVENSFIAENQPIKDCSNSLDDNKHFNINSGQTNSASTSGFATANSTMYQTTEGECYNEESTNEDSFVSAKNEGNNEHATVDSTMFTTADDIKENSNTFMSFENELPQDATIKTPGRILNLDIDTTSTSGPRQSTPLNDKSNSPETSLSSNEIPPDNLQLRGNHSSPNQSTPVTNKPEETETTLSSEASNILPNVAEHERSLPDFSGDESSFGDPSSPRTLSRQSSAFGNVTLEFETDWEASMKGMQEEAEMKPQYEEKHKVILHELSFEDNHRLKAPELLCPVFLAVQDDDDGDDEDRNKMKKMSQSIDDLCEMISEDSDDDQDHPLRRRAMSLEGKKPPLRDHRKKAPTREELMAAFAELHHEIMEDKEMEEEGEEEINEEDEEQNRITGGEIVDNQEQYEKQSGVDDPLRWHTVVFNGQHKVIDLKLLEPFLKVLTHGGYHHDGEKKTVIVVLTACNLPDKKMKRYPFLMEQLFFFIISTMDLLVTSEEYIFVYFHGGTGKNQSPSFSWLKKYYQYIDHRLRKSVTKVFVVHPNLWLKSVFRLCRPFLSSNFARKLKFVSTLKELSSHIKTDFIFIPDEVFRVDPDYRKLHAS